MARLAKGLNRTKPWKAEIRCDGWPYFIGYYRTKELAVAAEKRVRKIHPDARKLPRPW